MDERETYSKKSLILRNLKLFGCMMEDHCNKDMKDSGLTARQFDVLMYLKNYAGKEVTQVMIEKDFQLSNPTVSGILKRLEQNGFIRRAAGTQDKRCNHIVLTNKAYCQLVLAEEKWKVQEAELFAEISSKEEQQFFDVLVKLCRNITKMRLKQEKE